MQPPPTPRRAGRWPTRSMELDPSGRLKAPKIERHKEDQRDVRPVGTTTAMNRRRLTPTETHK